MPPTNLTPATATVLTFPHDEEYNVFGAPEELALIPPCESNAYQSVWFKYTTGAGERFIYINVNTVASTDANYDPLCSVWIASGASYIPYEIVTPNQTFSYCASLVSGVYFRIPVEPNTSYYFQIVNENNADPTNSIFRLRGEKPPSETALSGSFVIPDDSDGFPAAIIDDSTGEFLSFPQFPAGEFTATLPNGVYCTQDGEVDTGIVILDANFNEIADRDWAPNNVVGIKSDQTAFFYVVVNTGGGSRTIYKLDPSDASIVDSWLLPSDFNNNRTWAIERDGSILYGALVNSDNAPVHVYDLATDTQLADLATGVVGEMFSGPGDGYIDINGRLILGKRVTASGVKKIVGYNTSTGAIVFSYNLSGIGTSAAAFNHYCIYSDVPNKVLIWGYPTGVNNLGTFKLVNLTDGTSVDITDVPMTNTSNFNEIPDEPNAFSNSCPIFVLTAAMAPIGIFSGIYQITVGKRNDTYYTAFNPVATEDVPIPTPSFTTALLGDE